MKYENILLSADGEISVWRVPKEVSDNLEEYCLDYLKWEMESEDPRAKRIRSGEPYFIESSFIEYLNKYVFPNNKSYFVEDTGIAIYEGKEIDKYKGCSEFNF